MGGIFSQNDDPGCWTDYSSCLNRWLFPVMGLFKWLDVFTKQVTKSFEHMDVFIKWVTKPFERMSVFIKRVNKPFERLDKSTKWVNKPFEQIQFFFQMACKRISIRKKKVVSQGSTKT